MRPAPSIATRQRRSRRWLQGEPWGKRTLVSQRIAGISRLASVDRNARHGVGGAGNPWQVFS